MPKATPNATKRGAYRNLCIFLHIYLSKIQNISPCPVPNLVPGYRSLQTTCTSRSNTGISDTLSNSYLVTSSSEGSSVTTQSSSRSLRVYRFLSLPPLSLSLSLFSTFYLGRAAGAIESPIGRVTNWVCVLRFFYAFNVDFETVRIHRLVTLGENKIRHDWLLSLLSLSFIFMDGDGVSFLI